MLILKIKKGFSILEVAIVLGIMALLSTFIAPFMVLGVQNSSLEGEVRSLVSAIRHVQIHNKTNLDNKKYGIKLYPDRYNLFIGPSFAIAESNYDVFLANGLSINVIVLSGNSDEVLFNTNSIIPINTGYLHITNQSTTYRVYINTEGLIYYQKL